MNSSFWNTIAITLLDDTGVKRELSIDKVDTLDWHYTETLDGCWGDTAMFELTTEVPDGAQLRTVQ